MAQGDYAEVSYLRSWRGYSRNVRLYFFIAALIGLTTYGGIFSTLFNLFLLRLGYGPEFIGLVSAVGSVGWAVFCLPAGWLGGRLGPRRVMIAGLTGLAIGNGVLALAGLVPASWNTWWLVVFNFLASGCMAMYVVEANPFLIASTVPEQRANVYSLASALGPLAAFAGSLLAGVLPGLYAAATGATLADPAPYRFPLLVASGILVLAVLAMLRTEEVHSAAPSRSSTAPAEKAPWRLILVLALVLTLTITSEAAIRTFFNVYLDIELGVPTAQIGLIMAFGQIMAAFPALATPVLVRRAGYGKAFVWVTLAVGAAMVPLALIARIGIAGLSFFAVVALMAIARPSVQVYQMEAVKPSWRDLMAGATTTGGGISWMVVGLAGGVMVASLGFMSMWLAAGALTVLGALVFRLQLRAVSRRREPRAADP